MILNVAQSKKIVLRETSIGIVEANAEKARETDIKEDHRLATLSRVGKWERLNERVVETGTERETLVDVMVGNVRADEKFMMLDGRVTEEIEDRREALPGETEMEGRMLEAMSVETVAEERMEEESGVVVRK